MANIGCTAQIFCKPCVRPIERAAVYIRFGHSHRQIDRSPTAQTAPTSRIKMLRKERRKFFQQAGGGSHRISFPRPIARGSETMLSKIYNHRQIVRRDPLFATSVNMYPTYRRRMRVCKNPPSTVQGPVVFHIPQTSRDRRFEFDLFTVRFSV
jgi:hypothetical protein